MMHSLFYLCMGCFVWFWTPPCQAIREAAVAGIFYPTAPHLEKTLEHLLSGQREEQNHNNAGSVVLIVPHGGYDHSGEVLARGFASLRTSQFDHIVLIGPRQKGMKGISVYWDGHSSAWKHPLKENQVLNIDPAAEGLARSLNEAGVRARDMHALEHSLEVQVPFITHLFPHKKIIPILVNNWREVDRLVCTLLDTFNGKKVLYIISSNFSQFLTPSDAQSKDRETMQILQEEDISRVRQKLMEDPWRLSAAAAVYVGLALQKALGLEPLKWLEYRQSYSREQISQGVVGYAAGISRPGMHKSSIP